MLFSSIRPNDNLCRHFLRVINAPTRYYRAKLIYELSKLARVPVKFKKNATNEPPTKPSSSPTQEILQPVYHTSKNIPEGAKALHKEHSYAHEKLRNSRSSKERLKWAKKIMQEIIPALNALYRGEKVEIKPLETERELTLEEKKKAVLNLGCRISKMKKKIAGGRTDLDDAYQDALKEKSALERQIKLA